MVHEDGQRPTISRQECRQMEPAQSILDLYDRIPQERFHLPLHDQAFDVSD
jgi:hypothetical protein